MKQIKVLGVLAIALTLGLAACGKGGGAGSSGEEEHVHTFETAWSSNSSKHWHKATCGHNVKGDEAEHTFGEPYDVVKATCTEAGSQKLKCTVCEYVKTETLKALGHDAAPAEGSDAWTPIDSPSCEEVGHHSYHCSKCNQDIVVEIPALGHLYNKDADGNDIVNWTKRATCEEAGEGTKACQREGCTHVETVTERALGHEYAKDEEGNDIVNWSVRASCEVEGKGTKACTREGCGHLEPVTEAAWGHKMVTSETDPADEGKATVRVYHCTNPGCTQTYFGFKATETGPNSGRLVEETDSETGDVGKRFWGRPIGNDVPLDDNGSADRNNHEPVYNPETQGDLFEYVFELSADQVAIMGDTVVCYADAKPADYLGGQDFWACDPSAEEWTPGYYIEGEKAGTPIANYRYILYVDGHPVEFDSRMKAPVSGSGTNLARNEFLMPYVFHFDAGEHSISLRMAGGYRSTFFNFTFRPYTVPGEITVTPANVEVREGKTVQLQSSVEGVTYKSASTSTATVSETGLVTGVKAGNTTITVSKEGCFSTEVPVTVLEKEGVITLALADGVIAPAEGVEDYTSSSSGQWYRNFKKDATVTYTFQSEKAGDYDIQLGLRGSNIALADNIAIKVNDVSVSVTGTVNTQYSAVDYIVGRTALKAGSNTMVITALADNSLYLKTLKLIPAEGEVPHEHAFANPQNQTDEAESTISSCECGLKHIKWSALKFNAGASVIGTPNSTENGSTGIKFGGSVYNKTSGTASVGDHAVYNVNVPEAAASAKLYMRFNRKDTVSAFSAPSGDKSPSYYEQADGTWAKYPWRYKLFINDVEVEFTPYADGEEPQTVAKKEVEYAFPCTFALKAGVNKVELQKWGGYTATIVDFTFEY